MCLRILVLPTPPHTGVHTHIHLLVHVKQICLQVQTASAFCNGTICPSADAQNFHAGLTLGTAGCTNGDRSMMFAIRALHAKSTNLVNSDRVVSPLDSTRAGTGSGGAVRMANTTTVSQGRNPNGENLIPLTWATSSYTGALTHNRCRCDLFLSIVKCQMAVILNTEKMLLLVSTTIVAFVCGALDGLRLAICTVFFTFTTGVHSSRCFVG